LKRVSYLDSSQKSSKDWDLSNKRSSKPKRDSHQQEAVEAMETKKRKLEESMGGGFKGVFDNVEPISKAGTPGAPTSQSPLSNYAPDDAGVDISGIMAIGAGNNWKNLI